MDVGEEEPRTILSGLKKYVPVEDLQVWILMCTLVLMILPYIPIITQPKARNLGGSHNRLLFDLNTRDEMQC